VRVCARSLVEDVAQHLDDEQGAVVAVEQYRQVLLRDEIEQEYDDLAGKGKVRGKE
jgi:hypothetical protein